MTYVAIKFSFSLCEPEDAEMQHSKNLVYHLVRWSSHAWSTPCVSRVYTEIRLAAPEGPSLAIYTRGKERQCATGRRRVYGEPR